MILGVMTIGVMGADDSCSTEEPTVEKANKKDSGKKSSGEKKSAEQSGTTAGVGDKLSLKGTTYQVVSAKTASSVGGEYLNEEANGVFVIVTLKLTNEEDEPSTIFEDAISLIGGNGSKYSTSTGAAMVMGDDSFFLLEEIQPGLTVKGKLVYDIPKKALSGAYLQVEDLFSDSTGEIDLGL